MFIMKKSIFLISLALFSILSLPVSATVVEGGVYESYQQKYNKIIDKNTKMPVSGAKIEIPQAGFSTYTDGQGKFAIPENINGTSILSVQKQNYKPFSFTISDGGSSHPLTLGIEKSDKFDISIDSKICHLGDNNYSALSANASQFRLSSVGPVYRKYVYVPQYVKTRPAYLVIGSIIGIDTALARGIGQNNITNAFATPPAIYFNGRKIAEIKINGDHQRIKIPETLIRPNQNNEVKITAGVNLMQTAYIDYDDIEFMNISIE